MSFVNGNHLRLLCKQGSARDQIADENWAQDCEPGTMGRREGAVV